MCLAGHAYALLRWCGCGVCPGLGICASALGGLERISERVSMNRRVLGLAAAAAVFGMAGAASADPVTYNFKAITANSVADVAIAEAQLSMVVDGDSSGNVSFS